MWKNADSINACIDGVEMKWNEIPFLKCQPNDCDSAEKPIDLFLRPEGLIFRPIFFQFIRVLAQYGSQ